MKPLTRFITVLAIVPPLLASLGLTARAQTRSGIVHDAEFYILEAQNGEAWAAEDRELDRKLAELRERHGKPPNIVYILWDDMAFGDAGIPEINKIRGFDTPNCNKMADEGIFFTRMYSEPSCTPTRAASITGRQPYRNGMYIPGFPVEFGGLPCCSLSSASFRSNTRSSAAHTSPFWFSRM